MGLLIRGARIIDPSCDRDEIGDLLIAHGEVVAIDGPGRISPARAGRVIDAKGLWATPGWIDLHSHLREPGQSQKETIASGTLAAVRGGYTSVVCMANTSPVNDSAEVTEWILNRARETAHCRVLPVGAVTRGLDGKALASIGQMSRAGVVAISDDGRPVMNSLLMRKAMEYARSFDLPVICHAEDLDLSCGGVMHEGHASHDFGVIGSPSEAEEILVARELALARLTGARVHIAHVSSRHSLEHIRRAKAEGLAVTCEVTPHHLLLTDRAVLTHGTYAKMAPPLRESGDLQALIEGLSDGTIDAIATDHAPHTELEKDVALCCGANGITGLETAAILTFGLVTSGKLSVKRWVESLTSSPARVLRRTARELGIGSLQLKSAGDVTLFDPAPHGKWDASLSVSKSKNSPWDGMPTHGKVHTTVVAGEVRYEA